MNYLESFRVGLEGLKTHKLRSTLTMLGIIFGVAAVISMLSIGEGAREEALSQIAQLGMHNVIVQNIPREDTEEGSDAENASRGLTIQDALALEDVVPNVHMAIPQRYMTVDVQAGRELKTVTVVGTTPGFAEVMTYRAVEGSFFTYLDELDSRRVCVLGAAIKRELFFFRNPLNQRIKIGDNWFTVIGVMERKLAGSNSAGMDMNRQIYIPLSTCLQRFTRDPFESEIDRIVAKIDDPDRIREAANIAYNTLKRRHNEVNDFQISIPEALLRQRQQTQRIFNIVMGCIAGISLLVGGIGIMNIMLASVLERTREIGIRRAIGATRKDIMAQFLFESAMLSLFGGFAGILLGWAMTGMITLYAGWRTIVSLFAILLAFGVSTAVGVLFGLYPARQAAALDPIESLRYE